MRFKSFRSPPTVRSAMTPFPHWVGVDQPVRLARAMMQEHGIRHLPVMDGGRLVGVIAERDVRLVLDPDDRDLEGPGPRVGEICSSQAFVVDAGARLDAVLARMAERHADAALVVKEERLVGIFTLTDACREFAELLSSLFPSGGDEAA